MFFGGLFLLSFGGFSKSFGGRSVLSTDDFIIAVLKAEETSSSISSIICCCHACTPRRCFGRSSRMFESHSFWIGTIGASSTFERRSS